MALPESDATAGREVAERLRQLVAGQPFPFDQKLLAVTISLGLGSVTGLELVPADHLLRQADANLYEAKRGGRNRVVG